MRNTMSNGAAALLHVERTATEVPDSISRQRLIALLNEDLTRECQAIMTYVAHAAVLKGAAYMAFARELEVHAKEELGHALALARQIDYLGGIPTIIPREVDVPTDPEALLQVEMAEENEAVRNYRERIQQSERLGEYGMAQLLRNILVDEQEHQIDLAAALGKEVVDLTAPDERA